MPPTGYRRAFLVGTGERPGMRMALTLPAGNTPNIAGRLGSQIVCTFPRKAGGKCTR
jgi:hypothetical protein